MKFRNYVAYTKIASRPNSVCWVLDEFPFSSNALSVTKFNMIFEIDFESLGLGSQFSMSPCHHVINPLISILQRINKTFGLTDLLRR